MSGLAPFLAVFHLLLAAVQVVPIAGFVLLHPRLRDAHDLRMVHLIVATPCLLLGLGGVVVFFSS